jgi:hypothetical protein
MGDPESGNQILLEKKQWLSVEAQEQIWITWEKFSQSFVLFHPLSPHSGIPSQGTKPLFPHESDMS